MKKAVLVVAVALLAMAMLATPVFAAPNDKAWHTVPAGLASNQEVTYDELTEACLFWGLPGNPYPAPPTEEVVVEFPYVYITDAPGYFIFTLQIGSDLYEGVSCNAVDMVLNLLDGHIDYHADAIWYLGKWGEQNAEMENGFEGVVDLQIYGWAADPVTGEEGYDYATGTFNLEGFGCFNHHTLVLYTDSLNPANDFGYCTFLGNRHKA